MRARLVTVGRRRFFLGVRHGSGAPAYRVRAPCPASCALLC
jgi:hypothetical protein